MKTILFPTDFSATANKAMEYALQMSLKQSAKLLILHSYHIAAVDPFAGDVVITQMEEAARAAAAVQIANLKSALLDKYNFTNYETILTMGFAVDEILNVIEERSVDLIVMYTGETSEGVVETLFGSNTSNVLEQAPCPMLIVPPNANMSLEIKQVVYATNIADLDVNTLLRLIDFAKTFEANVHFLQIIASSKHNNTANILNLFTRMQELVKYPHITYEILESHDLISGIESYLKTNVAHVLAMTTHHRSFLDKIFSRSITRAMIHHTPVPLLAIHKLNW